MAKFDQILRPALAAIGLWMATACASSPPPLSIPSASTSSQAGIQQATPDATGRPSAPTVTASPTEYRLDTGDELKITVFGEPDLSGTFILDERGDISMSLIGEVKAKDRTLRQLQRDIEARLKEGIMKNPQVSAEVVNYRPFYVSGEVNKPGEYPYISGLSLRNAIATAGDFTYRADKRRVLIKGAGSAAEQEVEVTPNAIIRPGDTIRVRECFFVC